jgi:hypothetical protein
MPGQPFAGGYYAGQIANQGGVATHYVIVADKTLGEYVGRGLGQPGGKNWSQCVTFCTDLRLGGYADWHMPTQNELEVLYYFLKPGNTPNQTTYPSGSNPQAVAPEPISTLYTAESPAQTTATSFIQGASQEFVQTSYWSSADSFGAKIMQQFSDGYTGPVAAYQTFVYCRAVRLEPITL